MTNNTPKTPFNENKETMPVTAPKAKKQPKSITQHGETRFDDYDWIRADNWEDVLEDGSTLPKHIREHLEAENAYAKNQFSKSPELIKNFGNEMASRVVPNQSSVPLKDGPYEYWVTYQPSDDYPRYMRRDISSGTEQIIYDANKDGQANKYFSLGKVSHSPDHKYIACSYDIEGSEFYTIRVTEIDTGKTLEHTVSKTGGSFTWAPDSRAFYYVENDDKKRPKDVKYHDIFTDEANDMVIYHEPNDAFFLNVSKSFSGDYIFIQSSDHDSGEISFFKAKNIISGQKPKLTLIRAREKGVKYSVQHRGNDFYIHTNINGAVEYKLMKTPVDKCDDKNWIEVIPHRPNISLSDVTIMQDYMIIEEVENALPRIIIDDYQGTQSTIEFPDPAYDLSAGAGYEFEGKTVRAYYTTLAHPGVTYEIDLETGKKKILKEKKLPNGHDPKNYVVERLQVTARDGEKIPVSILRHKSITNDGTAPLFQYGYGSYGHAIEPTFSSTAISLVDRGLIYAIAHIRGGSDKGQAWYENGKKDTKKNTFNDFVDVTEGLIKHGYGQTGQVTIEGRSAGGMLMGAVTNMRPDLYGAVIAGVAFVDVLNTISDPTLPLTPPEWNEWGDPITDKGVFDYMKSYSPYENIRTDISYPLIVAPAGLTDPRVTYWEPTKWIARLRDEAKGGPFLLKMNMGSGHFGTTARYEKVKERADEYAVCLQRLVDNGYDISMRVNYTLDAPENTKSKKPENITQK